jgi:predicted ATP-dependent serine protease
MSLYTGDEKCPQCGTTHEDSFGRCPEASSISTTDEEYNGEGEDQW